MKLMEKMKLNFLRVADEWLCDGYSIMITYIILRDKTGKPWLVDAQIIGNSMPFLDGFEFHIAAPNVVAGSFISNSLSKIEVLSILKKAAHGSIEIGGMEYSLEVGGRPDFHTEMTQHERWFADLHLQVFGARANTPIDIDFMDIDNELRQSCPPFDGLSDIAHWLGLQAPRSMDRQPSIQLRVAPPVDMVINRSKLAENELDVVLHAHPNFDITKVGLAVRSVPGVGLLSRKQVASQIEWSDVEMGQREGRVLVHLENADNVLTMLTLGAQMVRRQWIVDPAKAGNTRLIATQVYDSDLKRLKKFLFESTDSREFEKGIGSLSFLMGFSSALQVESDAPDLLLTTPQGRIVLIECTVKIADFATKLGKLVQRRQAMKKAFEAIQRHAEVYALLVCALPKDSIRHDAAQLVGSGIVLITQEQLTKAVEQLRHPPEIDQLFDDIDEQRTAVIAQQDLFEPG